MEVYTDGSCLGNPGPGGYACIFIKNNKVVFNVMESFPDTTNNRMELMGVINVFKYLPKEDEKVIIYCDSSYCIDGHTKWIKNWIKNGWKTTSKKDVANKDLWLEFLNVSKNVNFELVKVKSHIGIEFNELADKLAKHAARSS